MKIEPIGPETKYGHKIEVGGRYTFRISDTTTEGVGRVIDVDVEDPGKPLILFELEERDLELIKLGRRGKIILNPEQLLARLGEPVWNIKWPEAKPNWTCATKPIASEDDWRKAYKEWENKKADEFSPVSPEAYWAEKAWMAALRWAYDRPEPRKDGPQDGSERDKWPLIR